ncbi:MAG: hypothetical protein JWP52_1678 [Rhizobacter sp.]|nr:hypothetical protein [Rhizobacter sp.]
MKPSDEVGGAAVSRSLTVSHPATGRIETRLFGLLEPLMGVTFVHSQRHGSSIEPVDVQVATDPIADAAAPQPAGRPSARQTSLRMRAPHLVRADAKAGAAARVACRIEFADDPDVPFPYRGRSVATTVAHVPAPLDVVMGERVLARTEDGALWAVQQTRDGKQFRCALPMPALAEGEAFIDVFNGERFIECLVLLAYLRHVTAQPAFEAPALRAMFVLDDPNLHWPHYGHVDFAHLAECAHRKRYHMAIATIPMDAWFTHAQAAHIFRENADVLSLLIHGNNHARQELVVDYEPPARAALLQQAVRRIERLERSAHLQVSRVMVPPHGACSEAMLAELPIQGFEAACVSAGSLRAHNRGASWLSTLGFAAVEAVRGCLVLPRFGLTPSTPNSLLAAAFLGQPLIVRGHQQDLKHGLDAFDELADFINALGPVRWGNAAMLARLSHQTRIDGNTVHVRVRGQRADVRLPPEATQMRLDAVADGGAWLWGDGVRWHGAVWPGQTVSLADMSARQLCLQRVRSVPSTSPDLHRSPAMSLVLRRFATEARDRLLSF